MNVLDLCSGVGGLALGLRDAVPGSRVVAYVEREGFAVDVLVARMEAGELDPAPIHTDLRTFDGRGWRGVVDCITAGFPCQPVSLAGKGLAQADERWLWPEVARLVREVRPAFVFLENVPGLVRRGLADVVGGMAELGFDAEWMVLSAADVGAPHLRKRWWLLAADPDRADLRQQLRGAEPGAREAGTGDHGTEGALADSDAERCRGRSRQPGACGRTEPADRSEALANADSGRCQAQRGGCLLDRQRAALGHDAHRLCRPWATEPDVGRVADGVPARVDRLRAMGNAVVPAQAAQAFVTLAERLLRDQKEGIR